MAASAVAGGAARSTVAVASTPSAVPSRASMMATFAVADWPAGSRWRADGMATSAATLARGLVAAATSAATDGASPAGRVMVAWPETAARGRLGCVSSEPRADPSPDTRTRAWLSPTWTVVLSLSEPAWPPQRPSSRDSAPPPQRRTSAVGAEPTRTDARVDASSALAVPAPRASRPPASAATPIARLVHEFTRCLLLARFRDVPERRRNPLGGSDEGQVGAGAGARPLGMGARVARQAEQEQRAGEGGKAHPGRRRGRDGVLPYGEPGRRRQAGRGLQRQRGKVVVPAVAGRRAGSAGRRRLAGGRRWDDEGRPGAGRTGEEVGDRAGTGGRWGRMGREQAARQGQLDREQAARQDAAAPPTGTSAPPTGALAGARARRSEPASPAVGLPATRRSGRAMRWVGGAVRRTGEVAAGAPRLMARTARAGTVDPTAGRAAGRRRDATLRRATPAVRPPVDETVPAAPLASEPTGSVAAARVPPTGSRNPDPCRSVAPAGRDDSRTNSTPPTRSRSRRTSSRRRVGACPTWCAFSTTTSSGRHEYPQWSG